MLSELTVGQWIGAAFAALLVGLSKAGFGAGAGLLAVPLMTAVLGPLNMLPVMLLVLLTGDVFAILHYLRKHDLRNLAMLIPGLLLGVGAGALAIDRFRALPEGELWMRRLIGLLAVTFVGIQVYRFHAARRSAEQGIPYAPRIWHGVTLGAGAGLTSTLAHAGGPLIALFLLPQRLEKRVFVGTVIRYFFAANLIKLGVYLGSGLFTMGRAALAGALLPAVVVGTVAGVRLNRRFSDRAFRAIIYALALFMGVLLLSGWRPGHGGPVSRTDAREEFRAGLAAYGGGDYATAATRFRGAAQVEGPWSLPARFNAGLSLYGSGEYGEAERVFAAIVPDGEGTVGVRAAFNAGNCAFRRGRFGTASDYYSRTLDRTGRLLAHTRARRERELLAALRERAEFNLGLARRRAEPTGGGRPRRVEGAPGAEATVEARAARPGSPEGRPG
ncbi:MAG: sulfite exporter TauE/SafE family protein, partial [Candidatus Brocadiaceae bacterium]